MNAPAPKRFRMLTDPDAYTWRPLGILATYRLAIALALAVLFLVSQGIAGIAPNDSTLYLYTVVGYVAGALLSLALIRARRPAFYLQVYGQALLDIACLTTLIYANGSVTQGLGTLIVVAVAGVSILLTVRMASLFAALAVIVLLAEQVALSLTGQSSPSGYMDTGLLGLAIFIGASGCALLARRARENQALADQRGIEVGNLEHLNARIVQRMQTGVVVLDREERVRMMNSAAWDLLGRPPQTTGVPAETIEPHLTLALHQWQKGDRSHLEPIGLQQGHREAMPQFQPLGPENNDGTLVFLEDLVQMRARVQQEKLASLGRLTASIAHEIRNPLSAIVHAGQLLDEAEALSAGDRRLIEIINSQCGRLNGIIESILQLSRRQQAKRSRFFLDEWLDDFTAECRSQYPDGTAKINVTHAEHAEVDFDKTHLLQIAGNLVANAVKHGRKDDTPVAIAFRTGRADDQRPYLDIKDNGRGIASADAAHLFEPFFTTASTGTGLGLYLCRELCESNQARMDYIDTGSGGACFRISFSGPQEREE